MKNLKLPMAENPHFLIFIAERITVLKANPEIFYRLFRSCCSSKLQVKFIHLKVLFPNSAMQESFDTEHFELLFELQFFSAASAPGIVLPQRLLVAMRSPPTLNSKTLRTSILSGYMDALLQTFPENYLGR